jgi:hypothetical protein
MPPKKSPIADLTTAEKFLVRVASCLDTALRYREANPGGDDNIYLSGLAKEMVCRIIPLPSNVTQI